MSDRCPPGFPGDFENGGPSSNKVPDENAEIVLNPYFGKQHLTRGEALNAINVFSAILLADGNIRRYQQGGKKYGANLPKA